MDLRPVAGRVMTLMQLAFLTTSSVTLYEAREDLHRIDDVGDHIDWFEELGSTLDA